MAASDELLRYGDTQDPERRASGAVAIVDIHNGHIGCATVEHTQKCGHTIEARAISNAGWHRDNGNCNQAAYNAGQGAFHAGDDDQHIDTLDQIEPVQ